MFNEYQKAHMSYVQALPLNQRCYCGWYELDKCYSGCDSTKTRSDYVDECNAIREYPCSYCGALSKEFCTNKVGPMTWGNHSERENEEANYDVN